MVGNVGQTHEGAAFQNAERNAKAQPFSGHFPNRQEGSPVAALPASDREIWTQGIRIFAPDVRPAARSEVAQTELGFQERQRQRDVDHQAGECVQLFCLVHSGRDLF